MSLRMRNYNIAQIILRNLTPRNQDFIYSYKEMRELVKSKYNFTHKYLKDVMVHLKTFTDSSIKVPLLSRMDNNVRIEYDINYFFAQQRFERMTLPKTLYEAQQNFNIDDSI